MLQLRGSDEAEDDQMVVLPKLRSEAKAIGSRHYFTGKACSNGHIAKRFTCNGRCFSCAIETSIEFKKKNPELVKEVLKRSRNKHRESVAKRNKARYEKNADYRRAYAREYRINNPERTKATDKAYKKNNADRVKQASNNWKKANVDRIEKYRKEYYSKNRESILAENAKWYKENPEHNRANQHTQRAKRAAVEGKHTRNDLRNILLSQKGECVYCKKSLAEGWHTDHIVPIARGGSNWPDNIQILCPPCNLSKNDKDPIEFANSLRMSLP